jgi:NADP-dependent 3-hydroxy acid dehydrogenase YdfG
VKPAPATTAVVTGAGSGIGQAVALRLLSEGWSVALLGRRAEALESTRTAAGENAPRAFVFPVDISDAEAVARTGDAVLRRLGTVAVLVNAAGTNIPRRSLAELSLSDYHATVATNLHGAFYCVQAVLPAMRAAGRGTIVNINSEAGLRASAKSGAAYVVGKFGLAGLTQTINVEERSRGIRACSIFPGDVNTPILDKRPSPPPLADREGMLQPEDVAACVWLAVSLPDRAVVEELLVRPR